MIGLQIRVACEQSVSKEKKFLPREEALIERPF